MTWLVASSSLAGPDWLDLAASSALARAGWIDLAAWHALARIEWLDLAASSCRLERPGTHWLSRRGSSEWPGSPGLARFRLLAQAWPFSWG